MTAFPFKGRQNSSYEMDYTDRASLSEKLWSIVSGHYGWGMFFFVFLIPSLVSVLFWGAIASDRYVSEARFVVRSVNSPVVDGAAAFLRDVGVTRANDDAFVIEDYIQSRDMMHDLMRKVDLRGVYRRPEADSFTRYWYLGSSDSDEAFFRYFQRQLSVVRDVERGITTVQVAAYRDHDAKGIADEILALSEKRVNEMNARALEDTVALTRKNLRDATAALVAANGALTRYRNQAEILDPVQAAGGGQDNATALDLDGAMLRAQLQSMMLYAPRNPGIPALKRRVAAVEAQAARLKDSLAGGKASISNKLGDFEELVVKRELAEHLFENAQKEFNAAVQEAGRQQIYIEPIARPNLPDAPSEPRRLRYIATTMLLSFWAFLILYLLVSGGREHLNLS